MKFLLLLLFGSLVNAMTVTYRMQPNERACFYSLTKKADEKLAFYYAVQSGGSFDLDYEVTGPDGKVIVSGERERQADFVFSAPIIGEYSFCLSNVMSTFAEKLVDFDITSEHELLEKNRRSDVAGAPTGMETSLERVNNQLLNIVKTQKYFRTRENRNFATVKSTEKRIWWFAVGESTMIIFMAILQVSAIRYFFKTPSKPRI